VRKQAQQLQTGWETK